MDEGSKRMERSGDITMSRYIDADELINYLYDYQDCDIDIPKEIAEFPTADVRENVKGKWMDETFKPWGLVHHPYKCDQCGEHSEADSNFCPNCGADMRSQDVHGD
jgi:hypothetical protein